MNTATVTISSDVSHLGPDATEDDLERFRVNLEEHLRTRFGEGIDVRTASVYASQVSGDAADTEEIEEYVHDLERGNGWIDLL